MIGRSYRETGHILLVGMSNALDDEKQQQLRTRAIGLDALQHPGGDEHPPRDN